MPVSTATALTDCTVEQCGGLFIFRPVSAAAWEWIADNVPEDATWYAGGLVVEQRYARELADGMIGDGLKLA